MPGLAVLPIPLLVVAATYLVLRWWPLWRLRQLVERGAIGSGDAGRVKVTFGGTPVGPADYVAQHGPGGILSAPPELALSRFNRWASTAIKWSDGNPAIRFMGRPPTWLCQALGAAESEPSKAHV